MRGASSHGVRVVGLRTRRAKRYGMDRKLDLRTRQLLAHYRARPVGASLETIARDARSRGRMFVRLHDIVALPANAAA
jgi:hypothetical protein